jgi:DNA-directed RNA polymerase alpha subunit
MKTMIEDGLLTHYKEKLKKLSEKKRMVEAEIGWIEELIGENIRKNEQEQEKALKEKTLNMTPYDLELPTRILYVFEIIGVKTVRDIIEKGVSKLMEYKNFGAGSLARVAWRLEKLGFPEMSKQIEKNKKGNKDFNIAVESMNRLRKYEEMQREVGA